MSKKRTPWYPADVAPLRVGDYEVKRYTAGGRDRIRLHRAKWTGMRWLYAESVGVMPYGANCVMAAKDGDMWRGLASNPGAQS